MRNCLKSVQGIVSSTDYLFARSITILFMSSIFTSVKYSNEDSINCFLILNSGVKDYFLKLFLIFVTLFV